MLGTPMGKTAVAAREAIQRGLKAREAGDDGLAAQWFERASRLAPNSPTPRLLLAAALRSCDPETSLLCLDQVLAQDPMYRQANVGRIATLERMGKTAASADELDSLLRHFAAPQDFGFRQLADRIARICNCAGWIGLSSDGILLCRAAGLELHLDGRSIAAPDHDAYRLPENWHQCQILTAKSRNGRILGAEIDLVAIARVEGEVRISTGGMLTGWAFAPADPDASPLIEISLDAVPQIIGSVRAQDGSLVDPNGGGRRPRGFQFQLPVSTPSAVIEVRSNGHRLAGSPIRISHEAHACRAAIKSGSDPWRPLPVACLDRLPNPARSVPPRAGIDLIIPRAAIAGGAEAIITGYSHHLSDGIRLVIVDDHGVHQKPSAQAIRLGDADRIVFLKNQGSQPAAAQINAGLRHAGIRDVIMLPSSAVTIPPGAIARLANIAYSEPNIGTVSVMPLAENDRGKTGEVHFRDISSTSGDLVNAPVCGELCVFIRHDCIAETGFLRSDAIDTLPPALLDFALRAGHLGWRHVIAGDVRPLTIGGKKPQAHESRSREVLERLHPGFSDLIAAWNKTDPFCQVRFSQDAADWSTGRRQGSVVLVTHDDGGGVERIIRSRVVTIRDQNRRPIVVRPRRGLAISDGGEDTHPALRFDTVEALAKFLRADRPLAIEFHHTAAFPKSITRLGGLLGVPFDFFLHDYAVICPQVTLMTGAGRYCGEPEDRRDCEDCVADYGTRIPLEGSVADHRARETTFLRTVRKIIAPTHDAASRLSRFIANINLSVAPWEDVRMGLRPHSGRSPEILVAIVGAIGEDKGYNIVLGCARDAARRNLPLRFVVIGHTIDDQRLIATEHVFVTGEFEEGEAGVLLNKFSPALGFLPSIWPETWCFALSALVEAGLHVTAFDIGAQAERIRALGAGVLLPLDSSVSSINDHFLSMAVSAAESEALTL